MNSLAASSSTMKGEAVCRCTSQLWATASIQLPTLLTSAPIQIQRKAPWRRTRNMEPGLIARDQSEDVSLFLRDPVEGSCRGRELGLPHVHLRPRLRHRALRQELPLVRI